VTNADNYREQVFNLLTTLVFLDGYDRDDKEGEEDEEDGSSFEGNQSTLMHYWQHHI
jgi:hypothetical protein